MKRFLALLCALAAVPLAAQQSPSFSITESTFNSGGHPLAGNVPSSPAFQLSLGAVGDAVSAAAVSSAGFTVSSGFVEWFGPPGEVRNLRFPDAFALAWDPDGSVGDYALYRGTVTVPFDSGFGSCQQPPPPLGSAEAVVAAVPAPGTAFFYLVTARNRLGEESTKGDGRANPAACP